MTRVILTRHGETEWNINGLVQGTKDSPLTEAGIEQAKRLAERLAQENIRIVISSPLGRALATARIIAERLNIPMLEYPEFREISFGQWEGKNWKDLREAEPRRFGEWEQNPHIFRFPEGETFEEVFVRAKPKLWELCMEYPRDTICIVSHGVTLRVLVTYLMGFSLNDWRRTPWQPNTALNIFEVSGDKITQILVGDNSHIEVQSSK